MTTPRDDLPPIQFSALSEALLAQAGTLVPMWLPDGEVIGHEYVCGSLAGGKGRSLSVNLNTGKWADFASDDRGNDLLSLYAAIFNLNQGKAAKQVAEELGLEGVAGIVKGERNAQATTAQNPRPVPPPRINQRPREVWQTVLPVPSNAGIPTFAHFARLAEDVMHTAEYRVGEDLHGYVVRFRTSDGGKDTLPYTYCRSEKDGGMCWKWRQWDGPRPLYLPGHTMPNGRTVVVVEGEVKGEVLQRLFDRAMPNIYCVASWPGGCNGWKKADWSWLSGSTVLLWPDCDAKREKLTAQEREEVKDDVAARDKLQASKPLLPEEKQPGMVAMRGIGALLRDTHACTVSMLPIPKPGEKVDGWDARDAIEADGWTHEDVLRLFSQAQIFAAADPGGEVVDLAAAREAKSKKNDSPVGTDGAGGGGGDGGDDGDDADGMPWWLRPYWDREKSRWNTSRKLVIAALEHDQNLHGVVAFNELTNSVQCRRAWPWPHAKAGEVRGADSLLLGKHLTDTYRLPSISKAALEEAVQTVAHTEQFHPIREWLVGLKWDGTPRINKWLVHVLGESPGSINPELLEYLGLVGRYWLQGMVWRVMEPGCKFDYCPVLEGAGGLRKSTLVEVLAGKGYFSDTPFDMSRGKEAQEQVQGVWLYEIAELAALSKADVNAIKAFISSKVDRYRVAYGTTVESFPRQCVLVGTTNDDQYLKDRTGNRRWWPIPVRHQIKTEWVQRWREQLFAEAFALFVAGEPYTPTGDQEDRLFKPMQDSRLVETAVESQLLQVLTRDVGTSGIWAKVHKEAAFVTIAQLVTALGVDAAKSTPGLEGQIRGWLKQTGWEKGKKQVDGVRANGYSRPSEWPPKQTTYGLDEAKDDVPAASSQASGNAPGAAFVDEDLDGPF